MVLSFPLTPLLLLRPESLSVMGRQAAGTHLSISMSLTLTCSSTHCSPSKGAGGRVFQGWIPSLWGPSSIEGGEVNLVTLPVMGGASDVGLEEAESLSSVAATLVVRVRRAFIRSLKVGSELFSVVKPPPDERTPGRGWALFHILIVSPFLAGFINVFNLGTILSERIVRKRKFICKQISERCNPDLHQQLNGGKCAGLRWFPLSKKDKI